MKKLIINADDYGLAICFNRGILELLQKGIITSTTVMLNRKYTDLQPLRKIANSKNVSVGLHLELQENNSFAEIERQIKKFKKKFGLLPSHLDGHRHCHVEEETIGNTITAAKKYDLPVRSVKSVDRKILRTNGIRTPNRYIGWHPRRKERLFERLRKQGDGVLELVCHPGYFSKTSKRLYNKQREQELKIVRGRFFSE